MIFVTEPSNDLAETVYNCIQNSLNKEECTNCICPEKNESGQCAAVRKLGGIFLTIDNYLEHIAAENYLLSILQNTNFSPKIRSTALYYLKIKPSITSHVATAIIHRFEDAQENKEHVNAANKFLAGN